MWNVPNTCCTHGTESQHVRSDRIFERAAGRPGTWQHGEWQDRWRRCRRRRQNRTGKFRTRACGNPSMQNVIGGLKLERTQNPNYGPMTISWMPYNNKILDNYKRKHVRTMERSSQKYVEKPFLPRPLLSSSLTFHTQWKPTKIVLSDRIILLSMNCVPQLRRTPKMISRTFCRATTYRACGQKINIEPIASTCTV